MTNTVSRIISDETLSKGIHIESAGKVTAKAATSSAAGLAQFIDRTWLGTISKHKPSWASGRSIEDLLTLRQSLPCSRFNAVASIEMMARLWEDQAKMLGSGYTEGDLYLAHFAGPDPARKVLRAPADTPASAVFSAKAIHANKSILAGKTCGQVRAWANKKMASAGGRNWVAVYMVGARPATPPVVKKTVTTAATGGTGTVAVGVQQGWPIEYWIIAGAVAALVGVGAYLIWRHFDRKKLVKVEEDRDGLG